MAKVLILFFLSVISIFADDESIFKVVSFAKIKTSETVLQNYEESCGAAALATLMGLFGVQKSEKDILDKTAKTDMLTFAELSNTAKEFGFKSEGYKIDKSVFEKLTFPVIAKIEREKDYPHFVVVINQKGDFVSVLDPNFGQYFIFKNEFYGLWEKNHQGHILIISPKIIRANQSYEVTIPSVSFFAK